MIIENSEKTGYLSDERYPVFVTYFFAVSLYCLYIYRVDGLVKVICSKVAEGSWLREIVSLVDIASAGGKELYLIGGARRLP